jgi:hypothetical protein
VQVTLHRYRLEYKITESSLICSEWNEEHSRDVSGIFPKGKALNDNIAFVVPIDSGFNLLDIGKRKSVTVESVLIQGVDYLGREASLRIR